ncbi:MAG: nickel pincer cofactor biosynthesis protein LarC [Solobacterium sp.]|nr:nickel pincer cofactor biosynthesis protein LarC [Solobacterium sp.]
MKTLFIECGMGAAGDMLSAALLELCPDPEEALRELNSLGLPGVVFTAESSEKCGIRGTRLRVAVHGEEEDEHMHEHTHEHTHEHMHEHDGYVHSHQNLTGIDHIIDDHLNVPDAVRSRIHRVYSILAQAESEVHGVPVTEIHFHEVGTMDAVADITAFCYLLNRLNPDRIIVSPIHVGRGTVKCAHGVLPVPAPATARILTGIPIYSREQIEGELCTPTGAALLKEAADAFDRMPILKTERIGYGMGKKDFPVANCVRMFFGETAGETDEVARLEFNVDDMTGEELGYAMNLLLNSGAREVFATPVQMKKFRPGTMVTVICTKADRMKLAELIFRHTTTLGIRQSHYQRLIMRRTTVSEETEYGPVRRKEAEGYGTARVKYEFDDLARIADETGMSIREAEAMIRRK